MSAQGKLKTASQLGIGAKLSAEEVNDLLLEMVTREAETRKRVRDARLEVDRLEDIVITCDGIECVKHDVLVRTANAERREAARLYAESEAENSVLRALNERLLGDFRMVVIELHVQKHYAVSGVRFEDCEDCEKVRAILPEYRVEQE